MTERNWSEYGITIPSRTQPTRMGEIKMPCPKCSKNRNDRSLSVNLISKTWFCHRMQCQFAGSLYIKGNYRIPDTEYKQLTKLSDEAINWLANRKLNTDYIHLNTYLCTLL